MRRNLLSEVVAAIQANGEPMTGRDIAKAIGYDRESILSKLKRWAERGALENGPNVEQKKGLGGLKSIMTWQVKGLGEPAERQRKVNPRAITSALQSRSALEQAWGRQV